MVFSQALRGFLLFLLTLAWLRSSIHSGTASGILTHLEGAVSKTVSNMSSQAIMWKYSTSEEKQAKMAFPSSKATSWKAPCYGTLTLGQCRERDCLSKAHLSQASGSSPFSRSGKILGCRLLVNDTARSKPKNSNTLQTKALMQYV